MGQCSAYIQQRLCGNGLYIESTSTSSIENRNEHASTKSPAMSLPKIDIPKPLFDHIMGTVFGNCIGDAIGLITEFMTKKQATKLFGKHNHFEYKMKDISAEEFLHQERFATGDWTDDSDQMILILLSLIDNSGKVIPTDFAKRMKDWRLHGYPELGDTVGMGCGATTASVLRSPEIKTKPHEAAFKVWLERSCNAASNGGVMRTSILGIHNHHDVNMVKKNTVAICKVTHADPRCIASCIAVTTCIAMMLQGKHQSSNGSYNAQALTDDAFEHAKPYLNIYQDEVHPRPQKTLATFDAEDLLNYMNKQNLEELKLDKSGIGYTYKTLGAGFWALRQNDFRKSIEAITREAGDADTNCAVAGALLGCKLGYKKIPNTWKNKLIHKKWLKRHVYQYLHMGIMTNVSPKTDSAQVDEDDKPFTAVDEDNKASTSVHEDNKLSISQGSGETAAKHNLNPSSKEDTSPSSVVNLSHTGETKTDEKDKEL